MALFEKKTIIKNEIDYEKLAKAIKQSSAEIDYNKLAEAIVKASNAAEKEESEKRKECMKEFRKKYKIDDDDIRFSLTNFWRCSRAFLEYGEKQSEVPVMTFEMLKSVSALFFLALEVVLILFGFWLIGYALFEIPQLGSRVITNIWGLLIIIFGCFFRIPRIEVSVMKDKDRINIVFSSIMALLCAVFALLAII